MRFYELTISLENGLDESLCEVLRRDLRADVSESLTEEEGLEIEVVAGNASVSPAAAGFTACPKSLALKIAYRPLASLKPSPRNARTHSQKQIHKIAASLQKFGSVTPILIDDTGEVVAGHGRLAAAKQLGMDEVPTICLDHMSEADLGLPDRRQSTGDPSQDRVRLFVRD